jgi:hypothetical protein
MIALAVQRFVSGGFSAEPLGPVLGNSETALFP